MYVKYRILSPDLLLIFLLFVSEFVCRQHTASHIAFSQYSLGLCKLRIARGSANSPVEMPGAFDYSVKVLILFFLLLLPHFVARGCLMFIFMQFYSRSWVQSCRLLLSALIGMLLVIFVRQRGFQVIACTRCVAFMEQLAAGSALLCVWLNTLHKCLHRGSCFQRQKKGVCSFWRFLNYCSLELLLTNMHMSHAQSHLCSCYLEHIECCSLKKKTN